MAKNNKYEDEVIETPVVAPVLPESVLLASFAVVNDGARYFAEQAKKSLESLGAKVEINTVDSQTTVVLLK